ncbi:hypothetical protein ABH932_005170 [Streptacidiphilus sp. MAP5-52]
MLENPIDVSPQNPRSRRSLRSSVLTSSAAASASS